MHMLMREVLAPVSQRVGTLAGTAFATLGATSDQVSTVVSAVTLLCGVALDLMIRRIRKGRKDRGYK